jgi:hypothetical protein
MIDKESQKEMLDSIASTGVTDSSHIILNGNINHVLSFSSGSPRIQTNALRKFSLILSQPLSLQSFNPFQIQCALCKKVISYPCWYFNIKYTVNHFHYFLCFDADSPNKPSTRCYRRS